MSSFTAEADYFIPPDKEIESLISKGFIQESDLIFPVSGNEISVFQGDDTTFVSFSLPNSLTGSHLPAMNFVGDAKTKRENGELVLKGLFGDLKCTDDKFSSGSECEVLYNDEYRRILKLLEDDVESGIIELHQSIGTQISLAEHMKIWSSFSGDPLGVIIFN